MLEELNASLPNDARISLQFSNGWVDSFKKRNKFKYYRVHGEDVDTDEQVVQD